MKKRILLALVLLVCAAMLCACQSGGGPKYTVVGSNAPSQATQNLNTAGNSNANAVMDYDNGGYDPATEEGRGEDLGDFVDTAEVAETIAPTLRSEYAGATPVLLDPIDKPTPTPVPPLTFTQQTYEATKLHLTFEAPAGWVVDDTVADAYTLTNPDPSMAYQAQLTLTATAVSSQMNKSSLTNQVNAMLDSLKAAENVKSFSPSRVDQRNLMEQLGMYANYTAVLDNGEEIAGRVQATCVNKVLYTVHITYPKAYRDTYVKNVYNNLRDTLKVTK